MHNFISDATSPLPVGSLQLTTDATTTSKAQYLHASSSPLSGINTLSYGTKQNSASFAGGKSSYQLPVWLDGTSGTFTTLVYEPYENGVVTPGVWQTWDVDNGQFWSSRTVSSSTGAVVAGAGGAPFYTLAALKTACPNAIVVGFGVNIGSNNPSYNIETDAVVFNDTTYNFEPSVGPPTKKSDCKNDGWKTFNNPSFKNQGKCIDYVESHSAPQDVEGTLVLSNPNQKIKFDVSDEHEKHNKMGTVEYWNYEYNGGTLHYKAKVLCVGGAKSAREARVMFQIPAGHPGLSDLYIVSYVKEVKNGSDLYGHAATSNLAVATAWCETGAGFAPTMYTVVKGNVDIE